MEHRTGCWLLHPISLQTFTQGVVWLCRPGVPYLVELMQDGHQGAIKHEDVTVILPAGTQLPESAKHLASNLTLITGIGPMIEMVTAGITIAFDPAVGKQK